MFIHFQRDFAVGLETKNEWKVADSLRTCVDSEDEGQNFVNAEVCMKKLNESKQAEVQRSLLPTFTVTISIKKRSIQWSKWFS